MALSCGQRPSKVSKKSNHCQSSHICSTPEYIRWASLIILKTKNLWTECFVLFPCQATLTLGQMCAVTCPGSSSPKQSISKIWLMCTTASFRIMSLDIFIIEIRLCFCPDTESRFSWDMQSYPKAQGQLKVLQFKWQKL